jgi:hypothetical protein
MKSDIFSTITQLFSFVSTQFDHKVKSVQDNNEHEFDNSSSRQFFLAHGVQLRMSCSYTSPQNGQAEHLLRTTNNIIHTLLFQASMSPQYWVESIHTTTYLLNNLPRKTIIASYPNTTLYNTLPTYEHLQVLGCACYFNLSTTTPHKLGPRTTWYVFIGYSPDHKGYHCFDLSPIQKSVRVTLADPHWWVTMEEEYSTLMSNNTWDMVLRPRGANVVTGKWIFKQKLKADGTIERYKARWVLRGFT